MYIIPEINNSNSIKTPINRIEIIGFFRIKLANNRLKKLKNI